MVIIKLSENRQKGKRKNERRKRRRSLSICQWLAVYANILKGLIGYSNEILDGSCEEGSNGCDAQNNNAEWLLLFFESSIEHSVIGSEWD